MSLAINANKARIKRHHKEILRLMDDFGAAPEGTKNNNKTTTRRAGGGGVGGGALSSSKHLHRSIIC